LELVVQLKMIQEKPGTAPTDSRMRPDIRMMEKGQWDKANVEKSRLEQRHRQKIVQVIGK
jgi:hypothetical protein